jgi:hypothetical protein
MRLLTPRRMTIAALLLDGIIGLMLVLAALKAHAAPPSSSDPAFAPWFESLTNPATGISCCAEFDGHILANKLVRVAGDQYQVNIAGIWRVVPSAAVLDRIDNPTGEWVVFYSSAADSDPTVAPMIYCLVRPALT